MITLVMAAFLVAGCGKSENVAKEDSGQTTKAIDPQLQDALDAAFMSFSQNKDFRTAIAFYDKAITLRPDYSNAYNNRGCLYLHIGEEDRGIVDFDKAISLNPNDAMAYANRGIAHAKKGNTTASTADLDKARSLDPKVRTSGINLRISDVSRVINFKVVDGKIVKE